MSYSKPAASLAHEELIARVLALDGNESEIENNRQTLSATVDALSECTSVDSSIISSMADQLAVQPRFIESSSEPTTNNRQIERNNRYAKYVVILIAAFSIFSLIKWFYVSNNIKSIMHEVSSIQSTTADFRMRFGRYPNALDHIGYGAAQSNFDSVAKLQMGPQGQLLIDSADLLGSQIMLTPTTTKYGQTQWVCSTNSSWVFVITPWVCTFEFSLNFRS